MFRKILLTASVVAFAAIANAQQLNTRVNTGLKANRYEHRLSRFDLLNQSDRQIGEVGERVSALGIPSKASAQKMLVKGMKKSAIRHKAVAKVQNKAKYVAADTLFFESFEGWDGETMPFIPTNVNNWSTKSNIENITPYLSTGCPTWTSYEGDGYYTPYATNGFQFIVCMYGDDVYGIDGKTLIAPAPQQDEWLVSPTVNSINGTNYLSFDINYAAWNTHYFIEGNDTVFDPSRIAYDVEVLVTTSTRTASYDPEKYTSVYKLSNAVDKEIAATDMNNEAEVAQLLYMKWRHVQIPLKEFDGSNIRIAFRYTGCKGSSVLIDAVRVSDLLPVALFDRPEGSFYLGKSNEAVELSAKYALMPAYRESVWKNYSNEDALSYVWRYNVNGQSGTSADVDLTLPAAAPGRFENWPVLQANAGLRSDEYKGGDFTGIKAGGDATMVIDPAMGPIQFNLGNYDPTKYTWFGDLGNGNSAFGTGGGAFWSGVTDGMYNNVNGIANVFDAPTSPYVFNTVSQAFDDFFNLGATLACTIYKVTDLGEGALAIEDEVIAQTTVFTEKQISGGGYMVVFNFPKPIVVDGPIAISIEGLDDQSLITARPLAQALNHDSQRGYNFVLLRTSRGGIAWVEIANAMAALGNDAGNMAASFCMGMNATFPYIHSNDGNVFEANKDGQVKEFDIETYWNPNGTGADAVNPEWKLTCSDSWVKAETVVDELNQTVKVKVSAEALPSDKSGRAATVRISALACEETITVLQGDAATAINSAVSNNSYADGTYTLSGQLIKSADAKNGVYLVRKNGKTIKEIRK